MNSHKTHNQAPLKDLGVLVTRADPQGSELCQAIEAIGGRAIHWPLIEIKASAAPQQAMTVIAGLSEFDFAVFISPNAVRFALPLLQQQSLSLGQSQAQLTVLAMGNGTLATLLKYGVSDARAPQGDANSESLLAMEALQTHNVKAKKVLIFRGNGGREHLATTLRERGASVEYAEVYQRVKPTVDQAILLQNWENNRIDVILITSATGLTHLVELLGKKQRERLHAMPLLVVGQRLAALVQQAGFTTKPIISPVAESDSLVAALVKWVSARSQ